MYIYKFVVNTISLYIEQCVWGMEAGVGQSDIWEKPNNMPVMRQIWELGELLWGNVTDTGTGEDVVG
jgi:hypothetical protein